jgi:hypothetical protein
LLIGAAWQAATDLVSHADANADAAWFVDRIT